MTRSDAYTNGSLPHFRLRRAPRIRFSKRDQNAPCVCDLWMAQHGSAASGTHRSTR